MIDSEKRLRALVTGSQKDLIHNDLANCAYHLTERVKAKAAAGDDEAIFLDMMAAATMIAFAFEAYLNFVGATKVAGWDNWKPVLNKLKQLREHLGLKGDIGARPYSSAVALVRLRNTLAHGKPRITVTRVEAEGTYDELIKLARPVQPDWEKALNPEFVSDAYADVEEIWHELLRASGIDALDAASVTGPYGLELIR